MGRAVRRHVATNVVGYVALFIALGGAGWAAVSLPANSVGPRQIRPDAVRSSDVRDGALERADLAPDALRPGPRGATGPAGGRGPTGPRGPQGLRGFTGGRGPQGPAGPGARRVTGEGGVLEWIATSPTLDGVQVRVGCTADSGPSVGVFVQNGSGAPVRVNAEMTFAVDDATTSVRTAGYELGDGASTMPEPFTTGGAGAGTFRRLAGTVLIAGTRAFLQFTFNAIADHRSTPRCTAWGTLVPAS